MTGFDSSGVEHLDAGTWSRLSRLFPLSWTDAALQTV